MKRYVPIYMTAIGRVNYALFLLTLLALPLPWHITQPLWAAWLISWLLEFRYLLSPRQIWQQLRSRSMIPFVMLLCLLVWDWLSLLWAPDLQAAKSDAIKQMAFFYIFLLALFGVNEHYKKKLHIYVYVIGCMLSIAIYLLYNSYLLHSGTLSEAEHSTLLSTIFPLGESGRIVQLKHRQNYCMELCLALAMLPILLDDISCRASRRVGIVAILLSALWLGLGIYLTGSRIGLVVAFIVIAMDVCYIAIKRHKPSWRLAVAGIVLLAIAAVSLWHHPRIQKLRAEVAFSAQADNYRVAPMTREPRIYIWHTVVSHANEYGIRGLGIGSEVGFLAHCYEADGVGVMGEIGLGPHNQYLTEWMTLGPMAVLWLIAAFVLLPWSTRIKETQDPLSKGYAGLQPVSVLSLAKRERYYIAFTISVIYLLNMLTDSILVVIEPLYLLVAALTLLLPRTSAA